jgi:hypothetical protein
MGRLGPEKESCMDIEWSDDWEEQLRSAVQPALQELTDRNQPKMDALTEQYAGHPVAEIKPIVEQELAGMGLSFSGDAGELTRIATAISEGQQVILRPSA